MAQNFSTRLKGSGIQSLALGAAKLIESKDRGQYRSQFVVSNLAASGAANSIIYITDGTKAEVLPVFPSQTITLESDSPFHVVNPATNAGAINYVVGELLIRGQIK